MSDEKIGNIIKALKPLIEIAGNEAKYTGDRKYFNQLMGFFRAFMQEKNRRWELSQEGDKIVTKGGKI